MKLPFDKCYCIHLSESNERYNHIKNEFKRIGIEDQVEIWWTCKRIISQQIGDYLSSLHTEWYDELKKVNPRIYGIIFENAYDHYSIIKSAYDRGLNSILIMEDDIKFIKDVNKIEYIFNNIPKDYTIIKFHSSMNFYDDNFDKFHYILNDSNYKYSSMCYAMSRQGMELYLECCKLIFSVSDIVLSSICTCEEYYDEFNFYNLSFPICESINTLYSNDSFIGNGQLKYASILNNLF